MLLGYLLRYCNIVLDPRISYSGLKDDASRDGADGWEHLKHIDESKESLQNHFRKHYSSRKSISRTPSSVSQLSADTNGSPQRFNFTSRYLSSQAESSEDDEFDEYFNMKRSKDWEGSKPIIWWAAHAAQFPNLSRLARDILSIPGMF